MKLKLIINKTFEGHVGIRGHRGGSSRRGTPSPVGIADKVLNSIKTVPVWSPEDSDMYEELGTTMAWEDDEIRRAALDIRQYLGLRDGLYLDDKNVLDIKDLARYYWQNDYAEVLTADVNSPTPRVFEDFVNIVAETIGYNTSYNQPDPDLSKIEFRYPAI